MVAEHGGTGAVIWGGTLLAGGGEQEEFTVITSLPIVDGRFSTANILSAEVELERIVAPTGRFPLPNVPWKKNYQ